MSLHIDVLKNKNLSIESRRPLKTRKYATNWESPYTLMEHFTGGFQHHYRDYLSQLGTKVAEIVDRGEEWRLAVTLPPRSGKTGLFGTYLPAWLFNRYPDAHILYVSYNESLANTRSKAVEKIVNESIGIPTSKGRCGWNINHDEGEGSFFACGPGEALGGRLFDYVIVDDPIMNSEMANSMSGREAVWEYLKHAMYVKTVPDGKVFFVGSRWNKHDPIGRIKASRIAMEEWEIIDIPMIAPEDEYLTINGKKKFMRGAGELLMPDIYERRHLKDIRNSTGKYWWDTLYQQDPEGKLPDMLLE